MARTAQNSTHLAIEDYVNAVEQQGGIYTNYPVVINNTLSAENTTITGTLSVSGGITGNVGTQYSASLTPAAVAADTSAEQTFTVTGLVTGQGVIVNGPAPTAGTGIVNARVSAANTLALTFGNFTAASLTPAAGTYLVTQI